MKKLILSAMALVLALFTLSAAFAFTLSTVVFTAQDQEFYLKQNLVDPENTWMDEESWNPAPATGDVPCGGTEIPCKITIPQDADLDEYLKFLNEEEEIEYHDLVNRPEIEPRNEV